MLLEVLRDVFRRPRPVATPVSEQPPSAQGYDPSCFDVGTLDSARSIILTPEYASTAERWAAETPFTVTSIIDECKLSRGQLVLDYGCGIGRVARDVIARTGAFVVGVDISDRMRCLATQYVAHDNFMATSPRALDAMVLAGMRFDAACAIWVLQHCAQPGADIERIRCALRPKGRLHIVNNVYRAVPSGRGWVNDGLDVRALVRERFKETNCFRMHLPQMSEAFIQNTFCATYERPDTV